MILALGLPIELFYFLAVYSLAAGTFVGAVAVRFVCKRLPRIGNPAVRFEYTVISTSTRAACRRPRERGSSSRRSGRSSAGKRPGTVWRPFLKEVREPKRQLLPKSCR